MRSYVIGTLEPRREMFRSPEKIILQSLTAHSWL